MFVTSVAINHEHRECCSARGVAKRRRNNPLNHSKAKGHSVVPVTGPTVVVVITLLYPVVFFRNLLTHSHKRNMASRSNRVGSPGRWLPTVPEAEQFARN